MILFSNSTRGFYDPEINGSNIPVDAVEITHEQHAALLQGQTQGICIIGDEEGHPQLVGTKQ